MENVFLEKAVAKYIKVAAYTEANKDNARRARLGNDVPDFDPELYRRKLRTRDNLTATIHEHINGASQRDVEETCEQLPTVARYIRYWHSEWCHEIANYAAYGTMFNGTNS